jgi:regulator of Ty1 transposition protein 109
MASQDSDALVARLTSVLPTGHDFTLHHLSAPPANCTALFSAPPGQEPEPTECEPHFLSISIEDNGAIVQIFAVEVLIYTTRTLTTIFVSKADSTGYLSLANISKSSASPIKSVVSAFLEHLVQTKSRHDTRLVLSLFARAQDQYLFPGSIENKGKHVLDDRGLIKWWCRIFDSILQRYSPSSKVNDEASGAHLGRGYLVVPGCEANEVKSFFPRPYDKNRWLPTDPLRLLGKSLTLPERCLIPRFPDDPKARFVIDLDDELPENGPQPRNSPEKNPHPGKWRSVRSIEQFWELMAFRQECAAGRLVGFLWAVFESEELRDRPDETIAEESVLPTPQATQPTASAIDASGSLRLSPKLPLSPLPTQIALPESPTPRPALTQDEPSVATPSGPQRQPSPLPAEVGSLRLPPPAYSRVIDYLLELDYDTLEAAKDSTEKFVRKVLEEESNAENVKPTRTFGLKLKGTNEGQTPGLSAAAKGTDNDCIPVLNTNLIRKKKRPAAEEGSVTGPDTHGVNSLSAGLVRKKPKV